MFKFRHIALMFLAVTIVIAEEKPVKENPADKIPDDEIILMQMHNDMFYGADDYFFEHRDVAFVDSVIPAAKLEAVREAVQAAVAQSSSGGSKPDSKDDEKKDEPATNNTTPAASTGGSSSGGTVVADTGSGGGSGTGGTDIPVIPEIPDIPDTGGGDCPT